jgi:hypothetical protein
VTALAVLTIGWYIMRAIEDGFTRIERAIKEIPFVDEGDSE